MPFPTPHITRLALCHEVPLDATYRNSIYWPSKAAQAAYFVAKVKTGTTFTDCAYHRETDRLRVNLPIQDCLDVNYCFWSNAAYDDKVYYAFVTGHHYVSANCTALEVQVDVLQTYYFDYRVLPSFIERAHSATDVAGENTLPEPLHVNRYHLEASQSSIPSYFTDWDVVLYATFDPSTYQYYGGDGNNGIWSALDQTIIGKVSITNNNGQISHTWTRDPRAVLRDIVNNHANLVEGIVAIVMRPSNFVGAPVRSITVPKPTAFGSYTPRNKKLLTYPYTKLYVTDGNGAGRDYHFEDFTGNATEAHFFLASDEAPNTSVTCVPTMYKGVIYDITESIVMSGFPQCAWVSNSFQSYLASNQSNLILSSALGAAQLIGGAAVTIASSGTGAAIGGGMMISGATQLAGILGGLVQEVKKPNQAHGNVTNSSFFTQGKKGFEFYTMRPESEEYRVIDDYFDMYGYATMRIGVPNIAARPHWTFVKTVSCAVAPNANGACTAKALTDIQTIYDKGVTFWRVASEVGDYSLDNTV